MPTGEKDSQDPSTDITLNRRNVLLSSASLIALTATGATTAEAQQPQPAAPAPTGSKPNIIFIMGDDIGWFNIGAYHQGMMAGRTPNLDRLASEGMRFTDRYSGTGGNDSYGSQVYGLCDRPIRQEPPR